MVSRFGGKIGAFAYLLLILLYFPCVAAFGTMIREVGKNWAVVGELWATALAYFSATVFYQIGTYLAPNEFLVMDWRVNIDSN